MSSLKEHHELTCEFVVMGKNGVDINHPVVKEFIAARTKTFADSYEQSQYKDGLPKAPDKWPDTAFFIGRDGVNGPIVAGSRLVVRDALTINDPKADKLPIAMGGAAREDNRPTAVTIDASRVPGNPLFMEIGSIFTDKTHRGNRYGEEIGAYMLRYIYQTYEKTPYVLLAETVPATTKGCQMAFEALDNEQTIPHLGHIYSRINIPLTVVATSNIPKETMPLESMLSIKRENLGAHGQKLQLSQTGGIILRSSL